MFGESTQTSQNIEQDKSALVSLFAVAVPGKIKRQIYIYIVSARACAYIYIYTSSSSSSRLERERFSSILLLLFLLHKVRKKKRIGERSPPREKETQREREGDFIDSFLRWSSR